MTYAALMVHLEPTETNDSALQVTGDLAELFGSHVIGIAALEQLAPLYFAEGAFAQETEERERAHITKRLQATEQLFSSVLRARAQSIEWRSAMTRPTPYIAQEARAADLIVSGMNQAMRASPTQVDPGELVLQAGRPLLLVPPTIKWLRLGSALVAWKDTREARCALKEALPILKHFRHVAVAEIVEVSSDLDSARNRVDDVEAWLKRHGITSSGMALQETHDVIDRLNLIAGDVGADLIVAGAYGHSRTSQWIFGGVSRDLLMRSERCCLLAH